MGGKWTTIGAISEVFDGPHATPKKIEDGPYFLSISSLENGKLDLSKSARISEEQFKKWTRRVTPEPGDVLFSYETRLGEAALMPEGVRACLGRRMGLLRPDREKVDPRFLLFAYLGPEFQQEIKTRTNYGATVERIALKELPDFPIRLPSLDEQRRIAHILGTLDEKIELNRQMNTTLEAMAQALFKSWFVDFDPVIDNALSAGNPIPEALQARAEMRKALAEQRKPLPAEIQRQFPSRFVFTEQMGWVPEGCEVEPIGDLIERLSVGKKFSQKTATESGTVPILDQGKSGIIGFHNEEPGVLASPEDPIIVFANHTCYMRLVMHNFSAIQNVLPFKGKSLDIYWLYFATLGKQSFIEYKGHWPDFVIHNLVVPNNGLDRVFGEQVASFAKSIFAREVQNESLANIRDTLLPKLLSGQLRIPDAEAIVEQAAAG